MTSVRIGGENRLLADASADWIAQQIEGRRRDRRAVCVVVDIRATDINMPLATPGCGGGGGGGRPPNDAERAVLELWRKHGLNEPDFAPGQLVAFLNALRRML